MGCNERYKWEIDGRWTLNGRPLFEGRVRLRKFHCNTPLILCPTAWRDVTLDYMQIVYRASEKHAKGPKLVGDLFAWNFAVRRQQREADVVLFPMESMTQVHHTGFRPWTCLQRTADGYWTTHSGEEVFTIHALPDKPLKLDVLPPDLQKQVATYRQLIANEWVRLNNACPLPMSLAKELTPYT